MKKTPTPSPKPKPSVSVKGTPISDDDDFGEQTFARAFKTVKETLKQVSPPQQPTSAPKRIRRSRG
jgi:hypothetical protein